VIGWAAATDHVTALPLLMFALIFLWTPPHFWALAMFVKSDYANAGVPMLPVVAGERVTRAQIGLYTIPMVAVAVAPWPLGLTHANYGIVADAASAFFGLLAFRVASRRTQTDDRMRPEKQLFAYSIAYLFVIFGALVVDRFVA
jgi:protoheme IX farnesyltransferase